MIPQKKLEGYIEEGIIEIAPLAFMRGRTLGDAVVILDEGQNTTINQLKNVPYPDGKKCQVRCYRRYHPD